MTLRTMAMLAAVGLLAQAKKVQDGQLSPVAVYVQYGFGNLRSLNPGYVEDLASKMFAQAGVQIQWRSGRPKRQSEQPIIIEVTTDAVRRFQPGVFAYARVYEGVHIRILGDRVLRAAGPSRANQLLAHVMVHEITHILEGIDRHSENGVMKAHWTRDEMLDMRYKPLGFDPVDIPLIHDGLAHRLSKLDANKARTYASLRPKVFH